MFRLGKRKRIVVIGLDGSPYTLIKKLAEENVMPNLNALIKDGNFYQMDTTIPEISSVAWSTFMTGKNSGEHGIFGFTDLTPFSYKLRFPNSSDLKYPPVWSELEKTGKRTVVINLPSTYPAKPICGILIAGFVALHIEKASYPERIIPFLKSIGYRIDVDTLKGREDKDFLIKDLFDILQIRKKAIAHFWDKEQWDLFIGVITGTDRIQHFLIDAFFDSSHKLHQSFLDYYNHIDNEIIKEIKVKIDDSMKLIILSDHGFTKIEKEVYLNRWLLEEDYIRFKNDKPESVEDIEKGSRAFVMDPGRIYINLKGKYPFGVVSPGGEYNELIDELIEKLQSIECNGKKIIKRIFKREEIYSGPYTKSGPDLVALSNYGFDLKGSVKAKEVFGNSFLTGMHTQDDAFVILPDEVKVDGKPHISQLKDIILGLIQ
ncbi:alkaline phosphatase family protein [candidate division WOR-3 bacterium]|nr:alkaline phosphatase family protein [candidate division WOR-3 bacterium]